MTTTNNLLVKHIAYELQNGNTELIANALPHWKGISRELKLKIYQVIKQAPTKESLEKLSSELYTFPKPTNLPAKHPLANPEILAKVLSYLPSKRAPRFSSSWIHTCELFKVSRVHSSFREQASFAYFEVIREKLSNTKRIDYDELNGWAEELGFAYSHEADLLAFFPKECRLVEEIDFRNTPTSFTQTYNFWNLKMFSALKRVHFAMPLCQQIGDFIKHTPNLTTITIQRACYVTDETLKMIIQANPLLEEAGLKELTLITEAGLSEFAKKAVHLKRLDLGTYELRDPQVISFFEHCKKLTHVSLSSRGVTDACLEAIGNKCPQLQSLELELFLADHVTSQALASLAGNLRHLTFIHFNQCRSLTGEVLDLFAQQNPDLQKVVINYCNGGISRGIMSIASHCSKLTSISIITPERNWSEFDDEVFFAFILNCPLLKEFKIYPTPLAALALYVGFPHIEFDNRFLKKEFEYSAKSPLGELCQLILKREPFAKIDAFAKEHPELQEYNLQTDRYPTLIFIDILRDIKKNIYVSLLDNNKVVELADRLVEFKAAKDLPPIAKKQKI